MRNLILVALLGAFFLSSFCFSAENQSIQDFVSQLERSLASRDFESYLRAFLPDLQDTQREALSAYFDSLKMETANLRWANQGSFNQADPKIFLQVIYQNAYSALIETWQLALQNVGGEWKIKEKKVRGGISQLYRIKIPSDRIERVESLEIKHVDINLTFKNALVFYDNVPDVETALLVMGDGHVTFSPSQPNERHQLELIYKSKVLEGALGYAFLRFSPSFFEQNIRIARKSGAPKEGASDAERARASSLFLKYRQHYFTIQSSLCPDPLSFVPQAEEAVIEFGGKKLGDLTYIYSPFADEEVTLYERSRDRYINLYSPPADTGLKRMVITFGQKYDVENYQIELNYNPQNSFLSAKSRIRIQAAVEGLDAVKFKFNPALEILRIYDEDKRELFFTQDKTGKTVYVYFFDPVPKYKSLAIEILYRGKLTPSPQVMDALAVPQQSDVVVVIPPRYETYLFSQSALWYPCPPEGDYFTARLKIIVPPDYSSISNGSLLEQGTLNGTQRVTEIDKIGSPYSVFETKEPVKYLTFLIGKLFLAQEKQGPVPLSSYVSSDVGWLKKNFLEEAQDILSFYERRFGPFPYESLRIVQRLWSTAGGLSPASYIVLNELPRHLDGKLSATVAMNPYGPVELAQWKEYFLAHEIAHQWWGQGVTWSKYRDQWLSEGLAQYSSVLYLQLEHGEGAFSSILKKFSKWTEKKANWGPITLGSRLSFLNYEAYQAIVYDKATLVLNMLHDLLGDELFFSGLQEFFRRYKYSAATTGQFKKTMEEVSGRDLDDFFLGWFDSYLLPDAQVTYAVQKKEAGIVLRIKVDQLNGVFVFPLWLEWTGENGGGSSREKLIVEKKAQEFEVPLRARPKRIEINPDKAVPGKFVLAQS